MSPGDIVRISLNVNATLGVAATPSGAITGGGSAGTFATSDWTTGSNALLHGWGGGGDSIIIYQGTPPSSSLNFIFTFNGITDCGVSPADPPDGGWCTDPGTFVTASNEPENGGTPMADNLQVNLSEGFHMDNQHYSGPTTSADRTTWLARISDESNWTQADDPTTFNLDPDGGGVLPNGFTVSISITVDGTGTGNGNTTGTAPSTINCDSDAGTDTGTCTESVSDPTNVVLTATADPGSVFTGWTGCDSAAANVCTQTVSGGSETVQPNFELERTITVDGTGGGNGNTTGTSPSTINCDSDAATDTGTCVNTVADGTVVVLTATADAGSVFTGWSGCDSAVSNVCTQTVSGGNETVQPNFEIERTLTIDGTGTGNGNTTGTAPSTINCDSDAGTDTGTCSEQVANGTVVVLTATADSGSTFTGWTGCDSAVSNVCTQTIAGGNETVQPNFELIRTLTIDGTGSGNGNTTGTAPSTIDCDSDAGVDTGTCSEQVADGTVAELTATADPGSVFTGWAGCDSAASNVCTQTASGGNETVQPNFELDLPDLVISKANDTGSQGQQGVQFSWILTVTNNGTDPAAFGGADEILTDMLPTGVNYGTPTPNAVSGITGMLSCAINSNELTCDGGGAAFTIAEGGSFTVTIPTTPIISDGILTNPTGGPCSVDADNNITETNESNNDCNIDAVNVSTADLTVSKTNSVGGAAQEDVLYQWTVTISNTGFGNATFENGDRIFRDQLPTEASYGAPTPGNFIMVTNQGNISCAIANGDLMCDASGGQFIIESGGSFAIVFDVTPEIGGITLQNPRHGDCKVDPNDEVIEDDENNNTCRDEVFVQPSVDKLGTTETINLIKSFAVPFWCGVRKDTFTMDGKTFVNMEQFETEIEVIFPQKRILLIFPGPQVTANVVESATITEPSNFMTPGAMTIPISARVDSGKTIRISCDNILGLPVTLDGVGDIDTILFNALNGTEPFHGILTLETDQDLKVFVTKIVRSWKGVDEGAGLDFAKGKKTTTRKEIASIRINIRKGINFEVPPVPFNIGLPDGNPNAAFVAENLEIRPLKINRNQIQFTAHGVSATHMDVQVYGLSGRKVFDSGELRGNRLRWNLRNDHGRRVSNGVYLYVVTVRGPDGVSVLRSEVKRLIVLR